MAAAERPADSRPARSRAAGLGAARTLVGERGVAGLTMERVALRSGVAKTTLYRHWGSRSGLLAELWSSLVADPRDAGTGDLRRDLEVLADEFVRVVDDPSSRRLLTALMDLAEADAAIATIRRQVADAWTTAVDAALRDARGRGEFDDEPDAGIVAGLLLGPILQQRLFGRQPVSATFAAAIADITASVVLRAEPSS